MWWIASSRRSRRRRRHSVWPAERRSEEGVERHRPSRDRRVRGDEAREPSRAFAHCADLRSCDSEERERTPRPAAQRRPTRHRRSANRLARAGAGPHRRCWHALVRPERERPRDRRERVAVSARDAARQDDQHCPAGTAAIAPRKNLYRARRLTRREWPFDRPLPNAVPDDHKRVTWLPPGCSAARAQRRTRRAARRRFRCPGLDVEFRLNDPYTASRSTQGLRGARRKRC